MILNYDNHNMNNTVILYYTTQKFGEFDHKKKIS
jgi:hypothetical protein